MWILLIIALVFSLLSIKSKIRWIHVILSLLCITVFVSYSLTYDLKGVYVSNNKEDTLILDENGYYHSFKCLEKRKSYFGTYSFSKNDLIFKNFQENCSSFEKNTYVTSAPNGIFGYYIFTKGPDNPYHFKKVD